MKKTEIKEPAFTTKENKPKLSAKLRSQFRSHH